MALLIAVMSIAFAACKNDKPNAETTAPSNDGATEAVGSNTDFDADWNYITGKGSLTIGITEYRPMNFKDSEGNLTGFDTEFAKAVCEKLGLKAEFIVINWATKESELKSKAIDCIWNGLTVTEQRKENMDFTTPYMNNFQVIVTKAELADQITSLEDMKELAFVAESESSGESAIKANAVLSECKYTGVDYQATALREVLAGTADAAVLDSVMAFSSIKEDTSFSSLKAITDFELQSEQYAIAFRKDCGKTLEVVNATIAELIADGTLKTLAEKYGIEQSLAV